MSVRVGAESLLSTCVNSHFSLLLSVKGTAWPAHTQKGQAFISIFDKCQEDLSFTVRPRVCLYVCSGESMNVIV